MKRSTFSLRREPFEHGLLPMHQLFPRVETLSSVQTVAPHLVSMAEAHAGTGDGGTQINAAQVTACLNAPELHTRLLFDTLLSLIPPHLQPTTSTSDLQVDVHLLLIFLVLQTYHRPSQLRTGDVWPAGDIPPGSPTSPENHGSPSKCSVSLTAARSKISNASDDSAQYSYVMKQIPIFLQLLKQGDPRSPTISVSRFNMLGLLLHCPGAGLDTPLSQACPMLNKPGLDAIPISAAQEWLTQNTGPAVQVTRLSGTFRSVSGGSSPGANIAPAPMAAGDDPDSVVIEGVVKNTILRRETDMYMADVRIVDCSDSVVYLLAPMQHVLICGCTDCTVFVGPTAGSFKVELCERVHIVSCSKRLRIASCHDSLFNIAVSHPPIVHGDCRNLQLGPFNSHYEQLEWHMRAVGMKAAPTYWDQPLNVTGGRPRAGHTEPGSPHSPESGKSVVSILPPEKFLPFTVPFRGLPQRTQDPARRTPTQTNPFIIPQVYSSSLAMKIQAVEDMRAMVRDSGLSETMRREFQGVVQAHFRDWMMSSGNMRHLFDLAKVERGEH